MHRALREVKKEMATTSSQKAKGVRLRRGEKLLATEWGILEEVSEIEAAQFEMLQVLMIELMMLVTSPGAWRIELVFLM